MSSLSFTLVIDISALVAVRTREWQEFARIGQCYLPQQVFEDVKFLSKRAPEPDLEKAAREFLRFYPHSRWQLTTISRSHPSLTPVGGEAMSKKARISLAVAECAYGLARQQTNELVVLVADDQGLLQRIRSIRANNLCGITVAALLQWVRNGQEPLPVTQQLQLTGASVGSRRSPASSRTGSTYPSRSNALVKRGSSRSGVSTAPPQIIPHLLALGGLAIAGMGIWWIIQPAGFNAFWQQHLPFLQESQPERRQE